MDDLLQLLHSEHDSDKRRILKNELSILHDYSLFNLGGKKVYELITADKYELPIYVTDTLDDMSKLSGYNFNTLYSAFRDNSLISKRYKLIAVDIREPYEKFNFCDYKMFCAINGLKESNFSSLESYKRFCYGG